MASQHLRVAVTVELVDQFDDPAEHGDHVLNGGVGVEGLECQRDLRLLDGVEVLSVPVEGSQGVTDAICGSLIQAALHMRFKIRYYRYAGTHGESM